MDFSLEISPKTDLDTLPALKDVYITMLPGGDYKDTADQANKLVKKGFNQYSFLLDQLIMKFNLKNI